MDNYTELTLASVRIARQRFKSPLRIPSVFSTDAFFETSLFIYTDVFRHAHFFPYDDDRDGPAVPVLFVNNDRTNEPRETLITTTITALVQGNPIKEDERRILFFYDPPFDKPQTVTLVCEKQGDRGPVMLVFPHIPRRKFFDKNLHKGHPLTVTGYGRFSFTRQDHTTSHFMHDVFLHIDSAQDRVYTTMSSRACELLTNSASMIPCIHTPPFKPFIPLERIVNDFTFSIEFHSLLAHYYVFELLQTECQVFQKVHSSKNLCFSRIYVTSHNHFPTETPTVEHELPE